MSFYEPACPPGVGTGRGADETGLNSCNWAQIGSSAQKAEPTAQNVLRICDLELRFHFTECTKLLALGRASAVRASDRFVSRSLRSNRARRSAGHLSRFSQCLPGLCIVCGRTQKGGKIVVSRQRRLDRDPCIVHTREMRTDARPRPILRALDQSCPHRIERNIARCVGKMLLIHHHRPEPTLPQMPGPAVAR